MQGVLFFESFSFCSRNDLEFLQPISQSLFDIVVNGSKVLPLRPISVVSMDLEENAKGKIQIFVEAPVGGASVADYEASVHDGDFAETFRRLQYTCVKSFCVCIRDSPFLRYWKAQETVVFTVVSTAFNLPGTTDYDAFDTIMNHLRPRSMELDVEKSSWHENGYNSEYLELLSHDALLKNLQTCRLEVWEHAFPPPDFFLTEPGYTNYELSCHDWCCGNVADGIDCFIEVIKH
ncbi:hypothetical protein AAVH_29455 [Aphelenchoides avenae]|nr:hypothetical protein AAVH_29455 [Aphelenchus avenae]